MTFFFNGVTLYWPHYPIDNSVFGCGLDHFYLSGKGHSAPGFHELSEMPAAAPMAEVAT